MADEEWLTRQPEGWSMDWGQVEIVLKDGTTITGEMWMETYQSGDDEFPVYEVELEGDKVWTEWSQMVKWRFV